MEECRVPYSVWLAIDVSRVPYFVSLAKVVSCAV